MSGGTQEPYQSPESSEPPPYPGQTRRMPGDLLPRLGARIIDSIVLGLVGLAFGAPLQFGNVWVVVQALLVFAYFVLLDTYVGTTAGKRLVGLRVTGPTGGNPTLGQASIREAFNILGAIPYAGGPLALIAWIVIAVTISSSPTKQGKHDEYAGGTQVIKI